MASPEASPSPDVATPAPPAPATPSPIAARASLLALAALALGSWLLEARVWLRVPSDADYAQAESVVRAGFVDGDTLVLAPPFAQRALERLGDLRGLGTMGARAGLALGTRKLWVIAEPGADVDVADLNRHYRLEEEKDAGALRVLRFHVADAPLWHAASRITEAEVRLFKSGGPAEGLLCDAPHPKLTGFNCPKEPDWMRSTVEWLDLGGVHSGGERAIWMHPPSAGDRKVLTWRNVPLTGTLVVGGGHSEYGARSARAPAHVTVTVGGRALLDVDFPPHHGWTVHRVAIPPELQGAQELSVTTSATNNSANHFAMDLGVTP
ncbi:MAG: hypothetical protein AB2A00_36935 [Myxococcota bacterium]